jgi:hypothetical protein
VLDRRLEMLSNPRRLPQLAAEPAKETHTRGIHVAIVSSRSTRIGAPADPICSTLQGMSAETGVGIVLTIVLVVTLVIVGVMFWWGAREDGRDQKRIDAQLRDDSENGPDRP